MVAFVVIMELLVLAVAVAMQVDFVLTLSRTMSEEGMYSCPMAAEDTQVLAVALVYDGGSRSNGEEGVALEWMLSLSSAGSGSF